MRGTATALSLKRYSYESSTPVFFVNLSQRTLHKILPNNDYLGLTEQ